ncbi:MAG: carbohydrate ABC transporter permease [Phycisphaerae bacterium]|nr:carbohydrate ABC transporter permease [Phycisphaerae bacterium]
MSADDGNRGARAGRGRLWVCAALAFVTAAYAAPLLNMVAVSLRQASSAATPGLDPLPMIRDASGRSLARTSAAYWSTLGLDAARNYRDVWSGPGSDFPTYLRNSMLVALPSVAGAVVSSCLAAYGFARLRWRGREVLFLILLATLMLPQAVLMVPQYLLFRSAGLVGTFAPLWLPSCMAGAFSVFLLRQFFRTIPAELDEAARIDGCSHLGILWRVIVPLSRPAIALVALLQFVASWNDFLGPLLYLNHQDRYTLTLGLHLYLAQQNQVPWNLVMAASAITMAPVVVVYAFSRRFFTEGAATQGLKE